MLASRSAMTDSARYQAIRALNRVLPARGEGRSLRQALAQQRNRMDAAEQGLMADLVFGVCRHYRFLDTWLNRQLKKPIKASAHPVRLSLLAGIYELWYTDRPAHAVVNAWPDVCRALKAPWASGLCNAILRKAADTSAAEQGGSLPPAQQFSLPDWLWQQWQQDWPDRAADMAAASLAEPPLCLRNNSRRQSREQLQRLLEPAGFTATPGDLAENSLYLSPAKPVSQLPGFNEGLFSVQDEAAQLPAALFQPPEAGRLLDACAAPGGKTAQLAELYPGRQLTALEIDKDRLPRIRENLERLGLEARLLQGDASRPDGWHEDGLFDGILVDAPCSATGILRRQPDVKWHRRAADLASLCSLQADMLAALWPLVRPGGTLVYATCSVIKRENEEQVLAFMADRDDCRETTPTVRGAASAKIGCQLLPDRHTHDGFYFARLEKTH
jgi:16S rRNA (cytosine967-C5)-methyltransferase